MPSLSPCPHCYLELTIPSVAGGDTRLRCAHCQAEFLASDVEHSSSALPPEATLVEPLVTATASEAMPGQAGDPATGAGEQSLAAWQPQGSAELPLEATGEPLHEAENPTSASATDPAANETDQAVGERTGAASVEEHEDQIVVDEIAGEEGQPAEASKLDGADLDGADVGVSVLDGAVLDGGDVVESDLDGAGLGVPRLELRSRRRSGGVGVIGQFVGIVGGAVLGLAIGYYILLWIRGPEVDFLKIAPKVPRWMLPPSWSGESSRQDEPRPKRRRRWTGAEAVDRKRLAISAAPPPGLNTASAAPEIEQVASEPEPPRSRVEPDPAPARTQQPLEDASLETGHETPAVEGPREFTPTTADELRAALAAVEPLLGCEHCQATGRVAILGAVSKGKAAAASRARRGACTVCKGKGLGKITPQAYQALCRLAEVVTFVRLDSTAEDRDALRQGVQRALERVDERSKLDAVGRLADQSLHNPRRASRGIMLAGTVRDCEWEGDLYRTRLVLLGNPKLVTVYSARPPEPALRVQDRVLILGSIVDQPRDALPRYAGDLPQVVWGGLALPLSRDSARLPAAQGLR